MSPRLASAMMKISGWSAKGQLLWQVDVDGPSSAPVAGTAVEAGTPMGYVQTRYGMEEIIPAVSGRVTAVTGRQGDFVEKGEIVGFVNNENQGIVL